MDKKFFGKIEGLGDVHLYRLENELAALTLMDFGAAVQGFTVFDTEVVGGFDSIEGYLTDDSHQGATIGRVANRVAGAKFVMDGVTYTLPKNNGDNCLHGGCGFDRRIWQVRSFDSESITFAYHSEDMEEGFPSALDVEVTYSLLDSGFRIDYTAHPYGKTPIALTNHSYFNLNGFGGTILDHRIQILADRYTEVDESLIPNGNHPCVEGTPFDLRTPRRIGERVDETGGGYDHNFVLCPEITPEYEKYSLPVIARAWGERIAMTVYSDQKNVQLYIGNFLGHGADFKGGIPQVRRGAFCLETQTEPNCINHGEGFYSRGETYRHSTVYDFSCTCEGSKKL